jgi:hypothetical protein
MKRGFPLELRFRFPPSGRRKSFFRRPFFRLKYRVPVNSFRGAYGGYAALLSQAASFFWVLRHLMSAGRALLFLV